MIADAARRPRFRARRRPHAKISRVSGPARQSAPDPPVPAPPAKETYTRKEVLRLSFVSGRQLASWERQRLIKRAESYSFNDLIALRTIAGLRARRVPPARIRAALEALRAKLRGVADPLAEVRLFADGRKIIVQVAGGRMEPVSGQLLLDFDSGGIHRLLEFRPSRQQERRAEQDRRLEAERCFQRGLELESAGAPAEQAIDAYQKAIETDPASAGALVNLGTIFFNRRDWARAEDCYRRALQADPNYALAHFNIGNLYDECNDKARALAHYRAALKINPSYSDAHYNLALLFQTTGEVMNALRHWRIYLKLDPASSWAVIARRELEKLRRVLLRSS